MATIEVSDEIKAHIKALAVEFGESEATILRLALENGMEDVEDYYRAVAAMGRLERGEEEIISAEELDRRLGLAG